MTTELPLFRAMPKEVRMLAAFIMFALSIGYAHAIGYVYLTTHIVPKGIEERYRGTETVSPPPQSATSTGIGSVSDAPTQAIMQPKPTTTGELQYEKSLAEMLNIIHTHIITMTLIFAISGFITLFTASLPRRLRGAIILEPFLGIVATFAGLWATRYLGGGWSWLVSVSGSLMALAFLLQCVALVLELRKPATV
jgi:hypothetical protein